MLLVRLCVIQFTRYRLLSAGAESFFSLAQEPPLVKNFFHFSANFFQGFLRSFCAPCRKRSLIIAKQFPIVKLYFYFFPHLFSLPKYCAPLTDFCPLTMVAFISFAPCCLSEKITPRLSRGAQTQDFIHRLRSDRSRRHFCGRPPRRLHRYPLYAAHCLRNRILN